MGLVEASGKLKRFELIIDLVPEKRERRGCSLFLCVAFYNTKGNEKLYHHERFFGVV